MKKITILIAVLLVFRSANSQWEFSNGPYGGYVNCILPVGQNIYAATRGAGVFGKKSTGNKWEDISSNIGNYYVNTLSAYGTDLIAGTENGIYIRLDGDTLWKQFGITGQNVTALAVSGTIVFAGTKGSGLFQTTDGKNWTDITFNLPKEYPVSCIIVNGASIYAGTKGGGVFASSFNSQNWDALNTGLYNKQVSSFLQSSSVIYAATSGGIFTIPTSGKSWSTFGLSNFPVTSIVKNDMYIFAGSTGGVFYRSLDGKGDWGVFASDLNKQNVTSLYMNSQAILAATENGGVFSAPLAMTGNSTWTSYNEGLANNDISSMAVSGSRIFAGTLRDGLFYSSNNGESWFHEINTFVKSNIWNFVKSKNQLYAVTSIGVYYSNSEGDEWKSITDNIFKRSFLSLTLKGANLFAGTDTGIYRSSASSISWVLSSPAELTYVKSMASDDSKIIAGTDNRGIYISTNDGADWVEKNSDELKNSRINDILISGDKIYAAVDNSGLFISVNNGNSWIADTLGLGGKQITGLAMNDPYLYAVTMQGIYRKNINTAAWKNISEGLKNYSVGSITFKEDYTLAGTYGAGVWKQKEK